MRGGKGATNRGFTIIELMISMAVGFSGLHLAFASGQSLINNNRLTINANRVLHDLYTARSHAILVNTRVTVQKTGEGWENGWIVFEDPNGNAELDTGEKLLQAREAMNGNLSLRGNSRVADYISYTGRGLSRSKSGAFQAGTLLLCDKTGEAHPEHARAIIIASSGRPRISRSNSDLRKKSCGL